MRIRQRKRANRGNCEGRQVRNGGGSATPLYALVVGVTLPLLAAPLLSVQGCARGEPDSASHVLTLTPSSLDLPAGLAITEFEEALRSAARVWSYPAIPCTSLGVRVAAPVQRRRVELDGINLVVFRLGRWCHNDDCGGTRTYPVSVAGMTTLFGPANNLEEADIELNGVHFAWSSREGAKPLAPLLPVLVHEIGHVLGLPDHCREPPWRHGSDGVMTGTLAEVPAPAEVDRVCRRFPRKRR